MKLAIVFTRATNGIQAPLVTVEAHLSNGMYAFNMVGLPETAVKESKHRVRSALMTTQFLFPHKVITVNLAPADLPKEGGRFDLPIALGILAASGQIPAETLKNYEFIGELALSGELRPVRGILPVVLGASTSGRQLIVPAANAHEAALVKESKVLVAKHLLEVCAHLKGETVLPDCPSLSFNQHQTNSVDLCEVKGQAHAKRALEIAAAGKHSLLFLGPPGTGKTMLASRLPTILPSLSEHEALECAAVASISMNGFNVSDWRQIPFRSPHHTSSNVALVGGGRPPRPGEISLAHHGILFLDELPEFSRLVLECLREPMESGNVTISRASYQTTFPALFQLIAAMNPCPCGYAGNTNEYCRCNLEQIKRYLNRISGPLLDRIDMQIEVMPLPKDLLLNEKLEKNESSAEVLERVIIAREIQLKRQNKLNVSLTVPEIERFASLNVNAKKLLDQVLKKFNLSARAFHRIVKVARTISDLNTQEVIDESHVAEALSYRAMDRLKVRDLC